MGYAISWLAVKDVEPASIQKQLGLAPTGEFGTYPEHPFMGRAVPGGWYLLVADGCDHRMVSDDVLATISSTGTVVACSIEEHVMYCCARLWARGKELWRVAHESEKGAMHLHVSGATPSEFEAMRQDGFDRQRSGGGDNSEVDHVFDIPLQLAKHFVGFKHDESSSDIDLDAFEILEIDKSAESPLKPSRWKLW